MKKYFFAGFAALLALALTAPAFAAQNVPGGDQGLGADEGAAGVTNKGQTASTQYFASQYKCTDLTASVIGAQTADCCIAGDIWRATVVKGSKIAHTGNLGPVAGNPAFAPGVYSAAATLSLGLGKVKSVYVYGASGTNTPGGLPAGWDLQISTNGAAGALVCQRKAVVGGTAAP